MIKEIEKIFAEINCRKAFPCHKCLLRLLSLSENWMQKPFEYSEEQLLFLILLINIFPYEATTQEKPNKISTKKGINLKAVTTFGKAKKIQRAKMNE